jgi:anaerobic magnesium-protoporphyrin IX monomethyl ester cyclase
MKITFVIPNTAWFKGRYWHMFPYTPGILAAIAGREGYEISVIDANLENLSEEQLAKELVSHNPDVVAVSAMTIMYKRSVHKVFEIAKRVNKRVVTMIGGIYPTISPDIVCQDSSIDIIVTGEAEGRLPGILKALKNGGSLVSIDGVTSRNTEGRFVTQPVLSVTTNLDATPFPDYSCFDMKKYMNYGQNYTQNFQFRAFPYAEIMTSRGCPYKCTFCSSNNLYGSSKIRYRSPENVLAEIDHLVDKYGIKEIIFLDDSLLQSRDRAIAIMKGMIDRQYGLYWKSNNMAIFHLDDEILDLMKESGCYQLSVSIESGHPNTLRRIRKPVKLEKVREIIPKIMARDIELISNFVIGFPGETMDEIRETFHFTEEINIDYVLFSIATPLPGTDLLKECVNNDLLIPGFSFDEVEFYGFGKGFIRTDEFTPFELQVLRAFEWDRINFSTQTKKVKIARMLGITLNELEAWRRETRRSTGVHVETADKVAG